MTIEMSAAISEDGKYRYQLGRKWQVTPHLHGPMLNYVMLNPSTADAYQDDQTIRVCMERARLLGYGEIVVTNLFAFRTRLPEVLHHEAEVCGDIIGRENDYHILSVAGRAKTVVVAWGTNGTLLERDKAVLRLLPATKVHHLGLTKHGHPKHPLRIPYAQPLIFGGWAQS